MHYAALLWMVQVHSEWADEAERPFLGARVLFVELAEDHFLLYPKVLLSWWKPLSRY